MLLSVLLELFVVLDDTGNWLVFVGAVIVGIGVVVVGVGVVVVGVVVGAFVPVEVLCGFTALTPAATKLDGTVTPVAVVLYGLSPMPSHSVGFKVPLINPVTAAVVKLFGLILSLIISCANALPPTDDNPLENADASAGDQPFSF